MNNHNDMQRHTITIRPSDVAYLKTLDASLSAAVRKLIDQVKGVMT